MKIALQKQDSIEIRYYLYARHLYTFPIPNLITSLRLYTTQLCLLNNYFIKHNTRISLHFSASRSHLSVWLSGRAVLIRGALDRARVNELETELIYRAKQRRYPKREFCARPPGRDVCSERFV